MGFVPFRCVGYPQLGGRLMEMKPTGNKQTNLPGCLRHFCSAGCLQQGWEKSSLICIPFLCTESWSWAYKQFWKWWWGEKRKQRKPSQALERCRLQKLGSRYCSSEIHFVLALYFQILLSWFRFPFSVSHTTWEYLESLCLKGQ